MINSNPVSSDMINSNLVINLLVNTIMINSNPVSSDMINSNVINLLVNTIMIPVSTNMINSNVINPVVNTIMISSNLVKRMWYSRGLPLPRAWKWGQLSRLLTAILELE